MSDAASPIPAGYPRIIPHLVVRGAAAAIEFYGKAFGAEESFRMPGPDGSSVMHAEIRIGGSPVFLVDENPDWGSLSPQALNGSPVTVHLYFEDVDAAFERAVAAGATVTMPLADMFWGDRYGRLSDPYGHSWSFASRVRDLSPEEIAAGMKAAMGGG